MGSRTVALSGLDWEPRTGQRPPQERAQRLQEGARKAARLVDLLNSMDDDT
jgi:hypothetical protein